MCNNTCTYNDSSYAQLYAGEDGELRQDQEEYAPHYQGRHTRGEEGASAICDDICFVHSAPTTKMYQLPEQNSKNKNFAFTSLILDHAENECRSILCNLQI